MIDLLYRGIIFLSLLKIPVTSDTKCSNLIGLELQLSGQGLSTNKCTWPPAILFSCIHPLIDQRVSKYTILLY